MSNKPRIHRQVDQPGFTLVEVLVVMVIISMMAGMVVTAVQGVTNNARLARTRTIIAAVDSVIQDKYDSIRYRPLPVEIPDMFQLAPDDVTNRRVGFEVLANEAARMRLIMIRDLQRMELPDRFSDFSPVGINSNPVLLNASCNFVLEDTTGEILGTRSDLSLRKRLVVTWNGSASLINYRTRLTAGATTANQGAECLYLIMSTTFVGGSPAIDAIPASNIGDTDGDGMPEILDGWGRPLGFVRWPVGYADPTSEFDKSKPDDFDLFRVDFAYATDTAPAVAPTSVSSSAARFAIDIQTGNSTLQPWAIRPLIVSAGSDGEFGIALDPIDSSNNTLTGFRYIDATWRWPVGQENMGDERASRANDFIYPDPYLRQFIGQNQPAVINRSAGETAYATDRRLPGEDLTRGPDDRRSDNVTNFEIQATL